MFLVRDKLHNPYQGRIYEHELINKFPNASAMANALADNNGAAAIAEAAGSEVVSVYYERLALLPWSKELLDAIRNNPAGRQAWERALAPAMINDPEGVEQILKIFWGEF